MSTPERPTDNSRLSSRDLIIGGIILVFSCVIFWLSPVRQVSDSDFSMLLSQNLIERHTFMLDEQFSPRPVEVVHKDYIEVGKYQLESVNGHVYYFFPPGSSVLSIPYVALLKGFGINAKDNSGTHGEMAIQASLAALLMGGLSALFYFTARMLLGITWSIIVTATGSFGSQVWSTASRGLWSHTWNLLLLGLVIYFLVDSETGRRRLRPALLATLLAWAYFVRPTSSIPLVVITGYVFFYHRRSLAVYGCTLVAWIGGFVIYSWHNFGKVLPSYYAAGRLDLRTFGTALAGNLISPSRGLLIYLPWIFWLSYLLIVYRRQLKTCRLVSTSLLIIAGNLFVLGAFPNWWGGVSYGPRLATDLLPWLMLLLIIAINAMAYPAEVDQKRHLLLRAQVATGALLLVVSIFMNGRGALSHDTQTWSSYPKDDLSLQAKIWDWRQPQFLAGLVSPSPPASFPLLSETTLEMDKPEAEPFLWLGWGRAEEGFRWTDGKEAAVVFSLSDIHDLMLRFDLAPFLVSAKLDEQLLTIQLNEQTLQTIRLGKTGFQQLTLLLPAAALKKQNLLLFKLPNAQSPESLSMNIDQRQLGVAVKSLTFGAGKVN